MRKLALVVSALTVLLVATGCGARSTEPDGGMPAAAGAPVAKARRCADGELRPLGTQRTAYVGVAPRGAVATRRPGGPVEARFGPKNVNDYPTLFGVTGAVVGVDCKPRWYRVQLPVRPNGATGFVRARALELQTVAVRVVVDVSERRLTLYRNGKATLVARVAVGSSSTPTPTGRFYVNQRLVPTERGGPYGPGAIGISAFSNVLTGWAQGGPVAIHGTNEPWSIGRAVSNGCIRLPNPTLEQVFRLAVAGTPVIIKA